MNHPIEDDLVLLALGDLEEPSGVQAHVRTCVRCRRELDAVERLLAATEHLPVPEPDSGFEERIWRRQRRLLVSSARHAGDGLRRTHDQPGPLQRLRVAFRRPSTGVLAGAMAVLIVVAFLLGRYGVPAGTPGSPGTSGASVPGASTATGGQRGSDRIFLVAVGDHLERARMVLVELINTDPSLADLDMSVQQERAARLLGDNRLYRQTARLGGREDIADVLEQIERVLVEVASGTESMHPAEVAWLRRRIQSRDLLFKVSVIEERARADDELRQSSMDPL